MYTPTQAQTIKDAISGSNTQTFTETTVTYKRKHLRVHTHMVYCSLLISNFCFSEDTIGTNADLLKYN